MSSPPIAVIDIGSNSGRVIVVRLDAAAHLEIVADARTSLRLMPDIEHDGALSAEAEKRIAAALHDFVAVARSAGAERIIAVATAAVREASNGEALLRRMRRETGVEVRVIDGDEEARLAFVGAVHGLPVDHGMLVDVGGGSLELSAFHDRRSLRAWTLPLGALRVTEQFLADDPPTQDEIDELHAHVVRMLREAGVPRMSDGTAVGTGGTIRNLAKVHRASLSYPIPRLHGYVLTRRAVRELTSRVLTRTAARRAAIAGLSPDRADSICGGALVVQTVMEVLGTRQLVVSGQGLREGIAFGELSQTLPSPSTVRQASLAALSARFSTWDEPRARRRARLAAQLLDLLSPDAGAEIQEVTENASTILDAGRGVDYYHRWENAATIVVQADLHGFSHRSIALLSAVITRAGRGRATAASYAGLLSPTDWRDVEEAAVVLAMADEVERRLAPSASPVVSRRDKRGSIVLTLPLAYDWYSAELATRFRRVFRRNLVFESRSPD
jgi:exopolyphosphatase / guanosine-5'-triphosphate,3'-diphosphate pyrophosphatase